ncbi:MAG: L-aspartate oxidase [SAR324 cluster bacterium]|nr:L-aspartate oxidase [SAR324 cluster bacterium]
MKESPLVVVGSGLAGLLVARLAAEYQPVRLITKNTLYDSNTWYSQGGIAAVWSEQDSVELHSHDTVIAGDGLCDLQAVNVLSNQSRTAIEQLMLLGVQFDKDAAQQPRLGLEGAHSIHRILHAGGDATGAEIQRALVESVSEHPNIEILEHTLATKIQTNELGVTGVQCYHFNTQSSTIIQSRQMVIATGGAGQLFCHTSNPKGATGDGVILAYQAGAELTDLEFYQFHPTALDLPSAPKFLISEALRGEGAVLMNQAGVPFMEAIHPQKDLAPRNVVSQAIAHEMSHQEEKNVYLDCTSIAADQLTKRFPTIFKNCLKYGIDIRKDWIPVTPVAHYMIGGVVTDLYGRTNVPGLYACGEVARTGVHGANRLASNSLLEASVFSIRVSQVLKKDLKTIFFSRGHWPISHGPIGQEMTFPKNKRTVQQNELTVFDFRKRMWQLVGLIRNEQSLLEMNRLLGAPCLPSALPSSKEEFELESMKVLGKLITESALERKESRGAHFREDFPNALTHQMNSIKKRIDHPVF